MSRFDSELCLSLIRRPTRERIFRGGCTTYLGETASYINIPGIPQGSTIYRSIDVKYLTFINFLDHACVG
jgi:hypothetical protein